MGLDDMGELELPAHFGMGGGGGMSEEAQLAAAIQASLSEMNISAANEAPQDFQVDVQPA